MLRPTVSASARRLGNPGAVTSCDSDWPGRELRLEVGGEAWRSCCRDPSGAWSARRAPATHGPSLRASQSARLDRSNTQALDSSAASSRNAQALDSIASPAARHSRKASREVWVMIRDSVRSLTRWRSRKLGPSESRELPPHSTLVFTTSDSSTVDADSPRGGSGASTGRSAFEGDARGPEDASEGSTPAPSMGDSVTDLEEGRSGWMLFRRRISKGGRTPRHAHRRAISKPGLTDMARLSYRRSRLQAGRELPGLAGSRGHRIHMDPGLQGIHMDPRRPRIRMNARRADRHMRPGSGDPNRMFALLRSEPDVREAYGRSAAALAPYGGIPVWERGPPVSWDLSDVYRYTGGPRHDRQGSGPSWSASGYSASESGTEIMPASPCHRMNDSRRHRAAQNSCGHGTAQNSCGRRTPQDSCWAHELPDVDEESELVVECSPWIGLQYERTLRPPGRRSGSGAGTSGRGLGRMRDLRIGDGSKIR